MNRLLALFIIAAVTVSVVVSAASWISRRKSALALPRASSVPATRAAEDRAMLTAQLGAVTAVVFSAAMFLFLFRASMVLTGLVGLPIALTAGLSISSGLLLFSALPSTKLPATALAGAARTPRRPWTLGGTRTLAWPLAVVLAYAIFLTATGLTSAPDGQGRYGVLRIADATSNSAAAPYPGWHYGVPLLLVTLVLAGSVLLALHRMASVPSLPDPRMASLDLRWREKSARIVGRLGTGALLGYFGGTAVAAGQAMATVAWKHDGVHHLQPLLTLGIATVVLGAALALAGVGLLVLAARGALTIRTAVRHAPPEPAAVP